jgi:hypothetical protein
MGTEKSCGDCTACCGPAFLQVEGLFDCFTRCEHATENGCGIYESRPTACREFSCLWLGIPEWQAELRPDQCGFIVHASADGGAIVMRFIETPNPIVPESLVRAVASAVAIARSKGASVRLELATQTGGSSVCELALSDEQTGAMGLLNMALSVIQGWHRDGSLGGAP